MTMNILVAGATGKTGRQVLQYLMDRESSDTGDLPHGVNLRSGDLADLPSDVCDNMDVVIFAAGSGGNTGAEMTDKVDRDGAKKLVDIAGRSDVKRFVMLSSVGADQANPTGDLAHYLKAKHDADAHLKA